MDIAPGIHVAVIGDRAVLLDSGRSRYFAVKGDTAAAVIWAGLGNQTAVSPPSEETIADLVTRRILTVGSAREPAKLPLQVSRSVYPSLRYGYRLSQPLGLRTALLILTNLSRSWRVIRRSTMAQLLLWLRSALQQADDYELGPADVQTLVDAYYAARPFFPAKPICRLDAIALCLLLRQHGVAAEYALGARLDPFAAHCWVQVGDAVIGEAHDRVRQFTPMLAV